MSGNLSCLCQFTSLGLAQADSQPAVSGGASSGLLAELGKMGCNQLWPSGWSKGGLRCPKSQPLTHCTSKGSSYWPLHDEEHQPCLLVPKGFLPILLGHCWPQWLFREAAAFCEKDGWDQMLPPGAKQGATGPPKNCCGTPSHMEQGPRGHFEGE